MKEEDMERIWTGCLLAAVLCWIVSLNAGCASTYATPGEVGAARGAAVGAIAGQAIGRNTKSTVIGAGVGALGGAVLNHERAYRRGY